MKNNIFILLLLRLKLLLEPQYFKGFILKKFIPIFIFYSLLADEFKENSYNQDVLDFVHEYVKRREIEPSASIKNNVQRLSLDQLRDVILSSYFLVRQKVPFKLGRLEFLFELRVSHERAIDLIESDYHFSCYYCIKIIDELIKGEILDNLRFN